MPKHEFRCEKCGTISEVVRKIGKHGVPPEKDEQQCECESPEFKKVITSPPRAAYGAGWSPYGYGGGKGNW